MKKRLISILLTVLMVVSLFSGMSLSAYAETATTANTIQYQMVNGDNVFMICQRLGLNFYDCKAAIMKLNGITDGMWSKLPVGKILTLPASNADGIAIGSAAIGGTTVTTGTGAGVSTAQISATVSDPVAYYLIPYTMSRGETVAGACNQLGINFNAYSEQIKKINGISNWTKVPAGSTLLLPSAKAPAVGTSCYAVLAHKVASGETAYSISNNKGVNYGGSKKLLEALNNTSNLNNIKAGDNFYVPVATTIAPAGSTGTGTGTGTATTTSTTTTSTTTPAAKTYKLSSNMPASAGTLQFYVNNKLVTEAAEGAAVTIVTETKSGKAIKSMVVKHANGKADLLLKGNSFIMPACDVRVDVEISSGHNIVVEANYANKAVATLGGIAVSAASEGSAIIMTSTDPTYEIVDVKASYKKLLGTKVDLPITSNGFVMPDAKVTVNVTLKPVTTYDFYVNDTSNGSFYLSVNGGPVSKAAKGAEVTIVFKAQDGYTVTKIEVKTHDTGKTINVFNNTFTMPAEAVDVNVEFGARGNNILIMPSKNGSAVAQIDGNVVEEADTGATVKLVAMPASLSYEIDHFDVVRNSDGYKVNVNSSNEFIMPAGGVTVTPVFKGKVTSELKISPILNGDVITTDEMSQSLDLSVFASINGAPKIEFRKEGATSATNGDSIDLSTSSSNKIAFIEYNVYVDGVFDAELTNQANLQDSFEMPNEAVVVEAKFESGKMKIGPAAITGSGTVSFKSAASEAISTCMPGDSVTIVLTPSANYTFNFEDKDFPEDLQVIRKDTGAKMPLTRAPGVLPGTYTYTFNMPADGVDIIVEFRKAAYRITMKCFDELGTDLTGTGLWQIQVGSERAIVDNEVSYHDAEYGDKVVASMTEAGKSAYSMISFSINGVDYTASVKNYAYNFAITGDRAAFPNIEIVATLRAKDNGPYNLTKSINDAKRGNVDFLITASESGYSTIDSIYDTKAYTGDTVAIIPSGVASGYAIDADHISITLQDGGVIHPTPVTIDGKPAYEFRMPAKGYKSLRVNFYAVENPLKIHVFKDSFTGTDITSLGLVYVMHDNIKHSDVLNPDAVGNIPYKSTVKVILTEMAKASGWKADNFKVDNPAGVTYKKLANGYQFTMPAEATEISIVLAEGVVPPTPPVPVPVALPNPTDDSTPLNLQYYKEDGSLITTGVAMSGETVRVQITTPLDPGETLEDGIQFKDSSGNVVLTVEDNGSFVVLDTISTASAPRVSKQYKVRIQVKDAPSEYSIKVDSQVVEAGTVLVPNKAYDTPITIEVTGAFDIKSVDNLVYSSGSGQTFTGKLEPAAEVEDGSVVDVTINFEKKYSVKLAFENDAAGTAYVVVGSDKYYDGDTLPGKYKAGDTVTFSGASREMDEISGLTNVVVNPGSGHGDVEEASGDTVTVTISFVPKYNVFLKVANASAGTVEYEGSSTPVDHTGLQTIAFNAGDTFKVKNPSREIVSIDSPFTMSISGDKLSATGTIPEGDPDGTVYDVTVTLVPWAKLKVSLTPADADKLTVNGTPNYWGDGSVSGFKKTGDEIVLKTPTGWVFDSISCSAAPPVDPSAVQNLDEVTIKVNDSIQDNVTYTLTIVVKHPAS